MTHTPGPWHTRRGPWKTQIMSKLRGPDDLVAEVSTYSNYEEGTSQLIAAAPDLLEACKEAQIEIYQQCHSEGVPNDESMQTAMAILYRRIKAAIARAEGGR